jgi:hypothetical protein
MGRKVASAAAVFERRLEIGTMRFASARIVIELSQNALIGHSEPLAGFEAPGRPTREAVTTAT